MRAIHGRPEPPHSVVPPGVMAIRGGDQAAGEPGEVFVRLVSAPPLPAPICMPRCSRAAVVREFRRTSMSTYAARNPGVGSPSGIAGGRAGLTSQQLLPVPHGLAARLQRNILRDTDQRQAFSFVSIGRTISFNQSVIGFQIVESHLSNDRSLGQVFGTRSRTSGTRSATMQIRLAAHLGPASRTRPRSRSK